jgi:hypothetical protein
LEGGQIKVDEMSDTVCTNGKREKFVSLVGKYEGDEGVNERIILKKLSRNRSRIV